MIFETRLFKIFHPLHTCTTFKNVPPRAHNNIVTSRMIKNVHHLPFLTTPDQIPPALQIISKANVSSRARQI